ncbi:NAD(P)H-hydrate dehydratase, partial [Candidatus Pacearchaeota archaeon]|nr:NAD(P)H-hydrate dehydratase [Candidatus Pacearchaeota archaeon]
LKINKSTIKQFYKPRKNTAHKGNFGKLLIIGGSYKYSGSPILSAQAAISALKTGTDIVEIISPKRASNIIAAYSPNLISIPLSGKHIKKKHLNQILIESQNKQAFIIGGGIEQKKSSIKTIINFLKTTKLPGVIDAGAIIPINLYKTNLEKFIFTPHIKEFQRLTNQKLSDKVSDKIKLLNNITKKFNTTILLKGPTDIISHKGKSTTIQGGTPYMTKAGTGDILAGILGGLLAQQPEKIYEATILASYINKHAGELSKKKSSLLATDLIKNIGKIVDKF